MCQTAAEVIAVALVGGVFNIDSIHVNIYCGGAMLQIYLNYNCMRLLLHLTVVVFMWQFLALVKLLLIAMVFISITEIIYCSGNELETLWQI